MFKVTAEPKFTHDVKVKVPIDGGFETQTFKATFRVLPFEVFTNDPDLDYAANQAKGMRAALIHMADLIGEDGQQIEYSDTLRDQLIAVPYVMKALNEAYIAGMTGAKVGN